MNLQPSRGCIRLGFESFLEKKSKCGLLWNAGTNRFHFPLLGKLQRGVWHNQRQSFSGRAGTFPKGGGPSEHGVSGKIRASFHAGQMSMYVSWEAKGNTWHQPNHSPGTSPGSLSPKVTPSLRQGTGNSDFLHS